MAIRFEWDEEKNLANRRKHGLSFEEVAFVFRDPGLVMYADRIAGDEQRWHTLGYIRGVLLVLVVHTVREESVDEVLRIISARYGESKERRIYEEEMVSYTLETLPPISNERWEDMKRFASLTPDRIDTSDIPEVTDEQAKTAVRGYVNGRFQHPGLRKKQAA